MMVRIDFSRDWGIVVAGEADEVLQTAVTELQQTLAGVTGRSLSITINSQHPAIALINSGTGDERFSWQATADRIEIRGEGRRGVLHGVYHFLAILGCYWLAPGDLWTVLPAGQQFDIPAKGEAAPAFVGRCLIIGHHAFMKDVNAWIVWAARNHYNDIFLHLAADDVGGGSVPEWFWVVHQEEAVRLMRQRGMTIEIGGHGLPSLLSRKLFRQMPEAFREENGRRTPQYNFCPSSEAGMNIIRQNARTYFAARPDYDVYHVWSDDIPGGGWCRCARCAGYSASDQLLLAINTLADVLAEQNPDAKIAFIAYLDSEAPPGKIQPRTNVGLLWAPRTRNYGRALDDPHCPVNWPYYNETLAAQMDYFDEAGGTAVFEYYSDAILFKSVLPILPHIMQQDLLAYRNLGVETMQTLMTGTRPWVSAQLTNWLFGRLTWQPEQDVNELVAQFCQAAFGEAANEMVGYYEALERAFTAVLHQTPDQRQKGMELTLSPWKLVKNPLADMEDPIHASAETLQSRAAQLPQLLAWIDEAAGHLAAARARADSPRLAAEAKVFGLLQPWLHFASYRLALYAAVKTGDPQARQLWQETKTAYDAVQAWGESQIDDPLYRHNFKTMQFVFWGLRLRRIEADTFRGRIGRFLVDMGTMVRLAGGFASMVWRYKSHKRVVRKRHYRN
jgi:hypothetical protein